jgi:hypothetical protein
MPRIITGNEERNRRIIKFVETYDWSFQLVADKFGVSRNVVAGIMFRYRHPYEMRKGCSPQSHGHNKTGTGWQRQSYYPSINARNSTVEESA